MSKPFAHKLSFRKVGDATKTYIDQPEFAYVQTLLNGIDSSEIECITLYGPADEKLYVLGKPGFYHLTLFIDETDGYAFDDGSDDRSKIEIAGDYWPSFRVCKDRQVLAETVHRFYLQGDHPETPHWLHFSED